MNTLTKKLIGEFDETLTALEADRSVRAAVLISAKPDNFIAGARRTAARRAAAAVRPLRLKN